jgi:hypothetical protein
MGPETPEYLTGFEVEAPIISLQVAPHPDGMYVVWRESTGVGAPPIRWTRYVASSGTFTEPGSISTPDEYPLEMALTSVGDRLVIAYGSEPDVVLRVMDGSGAMLAAQTFPSPGFAGHLALVGSPDEHSLLLATQTGGEKSRVEVTRFDCVP